MHPSQLPENDLCAMMQRILLEVLKGVQHGHFDFHLTCNGNSNGNRQVTFNAGLTHRYNLRKDDIPLNLFPTVTFLTKASTPNVQPPLTPPQGAQADTETNDEPETR